MKKKFWSFALALAVAFTPSATGNVMAAAGWQQMNTTADEIWVYSTGGFGKTYNSGGGNYKVEMAANGSHSCVNVALYEEDPTGADDYIATKMLCNAGDYVEFSVGAYVDGDNNRAELYAKVTPTAGTGGGYVYLYYYD